ncbi:MAG: 30S ribosome-binding factor RbfA [Dehalococcoidales bacterium]|nr:30S ribosome-binding factor RbfA [Dehalococcoidales bacterium]
MWTLSAMSHRIERVNALIRREVSALIQHELRDPRLNQFLSVTEVVTSPDLRHARVYVSSIVGEQEGLKVLEVLNAATGFLRSELAKKVRLRYIPELSFHWDNSIERGDRILRLLDQVNAEEEG